MGGVLTYLSCARTCFRGVLKDVVKKSEPVAQQLLAGTPVRELADGQATDPLYVIVRQREEDLPLAGKAVAEPEQLKKEAPASGQVNDTNETPKPPVKKEPWIRFAVLWVICTLSAGILPGQALFTELFSRAGLFNSLCPHQFTEKGQIARCSDSYTAIAGWLGMGMMLAMILNAPVGLFFDRWGARAIGAGGAACCAFGILLIFISLQGAASGYDSITWPCFPIGVFCSDFGSMLNSFSFFGLIWHFPKRQSLVISLSNCTYQVSALLPFLMEGLMAVTGATLPVAMLAYTVVVALAAYICWLLVPSQAEFYAEAKSVLGMPLPKPSKKMETCKMIKGAFSVLRQDCADHLAVLISVAVSFTFPSFYQGFAANYGEELFGSAQDGVNLAQIYVSLTAVVGGALAPFAGGLADKCGVHALIIGFSISLALGTITCYFATWFCQIICITCMIIFSSFYMLFLSRFLLNYSPPNRFGTVQGVYILFLVLLSLPPYLGMIGWHEALPEGVDSFRLPMLVFGMAGVLTMLLYACYFKRHPPPAVPKLLPEDEFELAQGFGCRTLEDVMEVVNISTRQDLLKMLASTDPTSQQQLFLSIDTDKLMEKMSEQPIETLVAMMERDDTGEDDAEDTELYTENTEHTSADEADAANGEGREQTDETSGLFSESTGDANNGKQIDSEAHDTDLSRISALGDDVLSKLAARDKQGLIDYLLHQPIADIVAVGDHLESKLTEDETKQMDEDFQKVVPGREFARLLRQRKELRTYVQAQMKKQFQKRMAAMRATLRRRNSKTSEAVLLNTRRMSRASISPRRMSNPSLNPRRMSITSTKVTSIANDAV